MCLQKKIWKRVHGNLVSESWKTGVFSRKLDKATGCSHEERHPAEEPWTQTEAYTLPDSTSTTLNTHTWESMVENMPQWLWSGEERRDMNIREEGTFWRDGYDLNLDNSFVRTRKSFCQNSSNSILRVGTFHYI